MLCTHTEFKVYLSLAHVARLEIQWPWGNSLSHQPIAFVTRTMKFSSALTAIALLASGITAASVPACSASSPLPCRCPDGTDYAESITTMVIGANAKDVEATINDFYKCGWLGTVPWKTEGRDNTVGSVRTSLFGTPIGLYNVSEKLIEYKVKPDGSFVQRFEQLESTIPLEYHTNNGSFSGYWITLEATAIFKYETLISWHNYACETGHARNFARFHEGALNNATSILTAAGKVLGVTSGPYSAQNF